MEKKGHNINFLKNIQIYFHLFFLHPSLSISAKKQLDISKQAFQWLGYMQRFFKHSNDHYIRISNNYDHILFSCKVLWLNTVVYKGLKKHRW